MPLCMLFIIHHHIICFQYFIFSCPVLIALTVQIFSSQTWVTLTKTYTEDTSLFALHFECLRHFIIACKNAGECFMWNNIIKLIPPCLILHLTMYCTCINGICIDLFHLHTYLQIIHYIILHHPLVQFLVPLFLFTN